MGKNYFYFIMGKQGLKEGHSLKCDEHKKSKCDTFKAIMQGDGNFVLYKNGDQPTWASNTNGQGTGPYRLTMQEDGNLVLYDSTDAALWASGTNGQGEGPYKMKIQADGNLVVYAKGKNAIWATGTNE